MNYIPLVQITSFPETIVPFLIFGARLIDVPIGTIRIIQVARGHRTASTVLGFFEVLIWLLAISQIVMHLTSPINYLAYAAGYATGTYIGMTLERRLLAGSCLVRVIVPRDAADLVMYLISHDYKVTHVDAEGALGPVKIIFTIVQRASLNDVLEIIRKFDSKAFYSVEDVKKVSENGTNGLITPFRLDILEKLGWNRAGK